MKSKKIFLVVFISLLFLDCYSQNILWEKSFGGSGSDYLTDALSTADYGFVLAGSSLSNKSGTKSENSKGSFDYWIWKMDEKGDFEWQKSFGGSGTDLLQSIKNTNDGGFILAGMSNSSTDKNLSFENGKKDYCRGFNDIWIVKLNAKGVEEWQKTIGGVGEEKIATIEKTVDGGYILGCSSSSNKSNEKLSNSLGGLDYWIIKLDSKGNEEWQKTYGGIYIDELSNIKQTVDKGYIVSGTSNSPASGNKLEENLGNNDCWILKLDIKGEIIWQKSFGGSKDDQAKSIIEFGDSGFLLAGNSNSDGVKDKNNKDANGTDFFLTKIKPDGLLQWDKKYDIGNVDVLSSMILNDDNTVLLGGYAQSEMNGKFAREKEGINDYVAIKVTSEGDELWRKSVGSNGEDVLRKAIETRDGGYLFVGTSNSLKANSLPEKEQRYYKSNESLDKATTKITDDLNKKATAVTKDVENKIKEEIQSSNNSSLKLKPNTDSFLGTTILNGKSDNSNSNKNQSKFSKDKRLSYGSNDFWIVKILDTNKEKVEKVSIEALPNPAINYTNVIVGYEFEYGTAVLADLAGRVIQQFPITGRTVPIDLQGLPEGIYVVNIKTDKQSDGVKIIKTNGKK